MVSLSRPKTAPDFLLSRTTGSVRTQGSVATYHDPEDAVAALKSGKIPMVVGALPFDLEHPCALTAPKTISYSQGPLEPPSYYRIGPGSHLTARVTDVIPSENQHLSRVEAAIRTIRTTALDKVVLARAVEIGFTEPVDPLLVAAKLVDHSTDRNGFAVDLTPAGGRFHGRHLVGCSPEVLVRRHGKEISCMPLAGSAPRCSNPSEDAATAAALAHSTKDHKEHQFVVDGLIASLKPYVRNLTVPTEPKLIQTSTMWHLASPITAQLKDESITALELALHCHPTPAVCGWPTHMAAGVIESIEGDRGFYGGAVGWCNADGNGEFMVAIRCAEMSADGRHARCWAGGGIVYQSDANAELKETTAKLKTVLDALGI